VGVRARARGLDDRLRELEGTRFDGFRGRLELSEQSGDVDALMNGRIGRKPPSRFLELALAAHTVAPPGLVPGDRDVDEPLEEIAFGRRSGAPRIFQLLMGREEVAGPNQLQAALERLRRRP
jgi:hypothetical protein